MCAKLLLAFLFSHTYAVTDGGHCVRRSGANPPLTSRQSDYLVANHLGTKSACQYPEVDGQQNVPKQRLDDDTRPDCAHNGPVEPYDTGGMPPGPSRIPPAAVGCSRCVIVTHPSFPRPPRAQGIRAPPRRSYPPTTDIDRSRRIQILSARQRVLSEITTLANYNIRFTTVVADILYEY